MRIIKIWLTAAFQIILINKAMLFKFCPLNYVENDLYFDRINVLTLDISDWNGNGQENANIALGVWITSDRILTSYNPFKYIMKNRTLSHHLLSSTLIGRMSVDKDKFESCFLSETRLACGRPLQFEADNPIHEYLWTATDVQRRNCPLHDLMVLRIYGNHTISKLTSKEYTMDYYPDNRTTIYIANVFLTEIARLNDDMGAEFSYVDTYSSFILRVNKYEPEDDAVVNCDEWLPRDWGHFICIRNKYRRKKMESGAMLVSDEKLFGVGSFLMFRGNESICVFTDVRPYYDLIFNTCTYDDSGEKPPKSFPRSIYP